MVDLSHSMVTMFLAAVMALLTGCSSIYYSQVKEGKLSGRLIVEWIDADYFIFVPDTDRPLTFSRYNRDVIVPERMFTDGGSIPRAFWGIRNYSPWGYGPAFIVHDWLFEMKRCRHSGYERYSFEDTADILAEVIKTLMTDPKHGVEDKFTLYAISEAVRSPLARAIWEDSKCNPPPPRPR